MPQYNDVSGLTGKVEDLYRLIRQLQTQPRLVSSSIDRGGTQSSDYDGTSIDNPGTRGWMIGTDETTGIGYAHFNGINSRDLLHPRRGGAGYIPVTLNSPYANYGVIFHRVGYLKSSLGIVSISGLINMTTTSNTVAFTLPPGYRPDGKIMFPVLMGSSTTRVDIYPNGDVVVNASTINYISLSGIMFPAAGVATWTAPTFLANWADYAAVDPSWAPCGYWRDSEGRVWQRGLARYIPGGTLGADSPIYNLPFTKVYQSHYPTIATNAFGTMHITAGTGSVQVVCKGGTSPTWTSLTRLAFVDEAVRTDWIIDDNYYNSWSRFSGFPPAEYMYFKDNIVFKDGLLNVSTSGTVMQASIPNLSPNIGWRQDAVSGAEIFLTNAGNTFSRVDIQNQTLTETPRVIHNNGGVSWLSYGGHNYVVGY